MKMEWIIAAIIGGLILVADFFAGFTVGQNTKETVKNEYTTQTTVVNQHTESIQQNLQIQGTIVTPTTNINININGYTNLLRFTNYAVTNAKTNENIKIR